MFDTDTFWGTSIDQKVVVNNTRGIVDWIMHSRASRDSYEIYDLPFCISFSSCSLFFSHGGLVLMVTETVAVSLADFLFARASKKVKAIHLNW